VNRKSLQDLTFIFTVGGDDHHYQNLERCIRSIESKYDDSSFLILEFGNRLKSSGRKTVIDLSGTIDFESEKKIGYIIWKHKYVGSLMIKTRFGVYVDTDTVLLNDTIPDILENLQGGIGLARHFWVPTISEYQAKATVPSTLGEFLALKSKIDLRDEFMFFAGGVFFFENNDRTMSIFKEVIEMYDDYYEGKQYVKSVTDELFLAASLGRNKDVIRLFGGALNHCSMGHEHMPLTEKDGILFGRNLFENFWQPITFLHCDTARRDPSVEYTGVSRTIIRRAFEMEAENE